MSELTDRIDEAEKEYAEASGEYALAVLKADDNDAPEAKAAENIKLKKLREYNELVDLKRFAEIAADGGEIEITVRGNFCGGSKENDFYRNFQSQYDLINDHNREIQKR